MKVEPEIEYVMEIPQERKSGKGHRKVNMAMSLPETESRHFWAKAGTSSQKKLLEI